MVCIDKNYNLMKWWLNAECEGAWHPRIHNKVYYRNVYEQLAQNVNPDGTLDCRGVRETLRKIKTSLENKNFPGVRSPKG